MRNQVKDDKERYLFKEDILGLEYSINQASFLPAFMPTSRFRPLLHDMNYHEWK
jgi:hypothetical protein